MQVDKRNKVVLPWLKLGVNNVFFCNKGVISFAPVKDIGTSVLGFDVNRV